MRRRCSIRIGASRSHSGRDMSSAIAMVFQGLDQQQAEAIWRPFFEWVESQGEDFGSKAGRPSSPRRRATSGIPASSGSCPGWWSPTSGPARRRAMCSGRAMSRRRDRCCTPTNRPGCRRRCCKPIGRRRWPRHCSAAAQHWGVALHFNKGLAGAPAEAIEAARDTATNPAVLEAFALAISAAEGPPACPGIAGHEPDLASARRQAEAVGRATQELRELVPAVGSYVSESDFFEKDWQQAFWGANYARLRAVKELTIPTGCSSCTTGWAARTGAPTGSAGSAGARERSERSRRQGRRERSSWKHRAAPHPPFGHLLPVNGVNGERKGCTPMKHFPVPTASS